MKKSFITAVESKDLVMVRVFLANELMLDPRGKSYNEMLSFAKAKLENLFEPDNGTSYPQEEGNWNEDLLFMVKNDLGSNFSEERLSFYANIAHVVLKDKCDQLDKDDAQKSYEANHQEEHSNEAKGVFIPGINNDQFFKTTAIAGAALTVLGCVTKGVVSGISTTFGVIGILAGSGYFLYKKNKK